MSLIFNISDVYPKTTVSETIKPSVVIYQYFYDSDLNQWKTA